MTKYFIIGSPSLNRLFLHKITFPDWNKWIINLNEDWKIIWFINIDIINKLDESYDNIKNNFLNIIDKRIEIHFLSQNNKQSLFNSCKNISSQIKNYVDSNLLDKTNIIVMWLEDNWKFIECIDINYLLLFIHSMHFMNLTNIQNNYKWSLFPSIISYDFWEKLFYNGWRNLDKDDANPEHCIGLYYRKLHRNQNSTINVTMINNKIDETFFSQTQIINDNNYYTFIDQKYNILENEKYIKIDNLKDNLFINKSVLLKFTNTLCTDISKTYMEIYNNLKNIQEQSIPINNNWEILTNINIFTCDDIIDINEKIENNKIYLKFIGKLNTVYIIHINNNKLLNITIENTNYELKFNTEYFFLHNTKNEKEINITLQRINENIINYSDINKISIFNYGNPIVINNLEYQIIYSFDNKYFNGAFASIHSLLFNFDEIKLKDLCVNIIIPFNDFYIFQREFCKFIEKIKYIKFLFRIFVINDSILNETILSTKCYKGGHHLLNVSNFARLIIGNLINCQKILYIDSDTIIQTDITKCLDKVNNNDFVILGKKSELNFRNLFNSNNIHHANDFLKDNFNIDKNIIYTGTLLINPVKFKDYFPKMIELVQLHNSLIPKGGLYKLFTMSILNIALYNVTEYFDNYINNVVDLGFRENLYNLIDNANVLDWSGIYKPWFLNGLYREYWKKYNIMYDDEKSIEKNKNTIESF